MRGNPKGKKSFDPNHWGHTPNIWGAPGKMGPKVLAELQLCLRLPRLARFQDLSFL